MDLELNNKSNKPPPEGSFGYPGKTHREGSPLSVHHDETLTKGAVGTNIGTQPPKSQKPLQNEAEGTASGSRTTFWQDHHHMKNSDSTSSGIERMPYPRRNLSGSKRRYMKKLRNEMEKPSTSQKREYLNNTPSQNTNPPKKTCPGAEAFFSENDSIVKLAVVPEDYPSVKLDTRQGDLLIQILMDKLLQFMDDAPSFVKVAVENGALIMVAANNTSAEWVKTTFPTLKPWTDAKLKVGLANEIVLTHRIHVWIPNYPRKLQANEVLRLLTSQNKGLMAKDWKVIRRIDEETRTAWIFAVEEDSLEDLRQRGFRLGLGIGRVTLHLVSREYDRSSSYQTPPQ